MVRIKGKKDKLPGGAQDVQGGFLTQKANLPVGRESSDGDGIRQPATMGPSRKGTE